MYKLLTAGIISLALLPSPFLRRTTTDYLQGIGGTTTSNSLPLTFGSDVTSGNSIICTIRYLAGSPTISDSQGNSYSLVYDASSYQFLLAHNVTGGSSFTVTMGTGSAVGITAGCVEVEGDVELDIIKTSGSCGAVTSCSTGATSTRTAAVELLVGASEFQFNANVSTVSGSWSAYTSDLNGAFGVRGKFFIWNVTSTGTDGLTVGYPSTATDLRVDMISLKAISGGVSFPVGIIRFITIIGGFPYAY